MHEPDASTPSEPRPGPGDFSARYQEVAPALHVWASLRIRADLRGFCDVDDLLQEAWCRAYAIRDRFDGKPTEFRPWMFRVAKNVLLEVKRRARQQRPTAPGVGTTSKMILPESIPDHVTSITRRLARDERLQQFQAKLGELPEEERELVVLIGLEGMTQSDVAVRLGIGHDAVRKRWQRLRAKLEDEGASDLLLEE